jgi:peptide/nickel transport system ATP-binding protein/oligopeptide transport system ATP-binding protein
MEASTPVSVDLTAVEPVLDVCDLTVDLHSDGATSAVVDRLNFSLSAGQTLGVVGESGCGKSMLALSIMGLLPQPPAKIRDGQILLRGSDLLVRSEGEMQAIRGSRIAMIFQEPMTSLNPVYTVGYQIIEALLAHKRLTQAEARAKAIELLKRVGIPNAERRIDEFPHRLSGGMRQRVMIAMALACDPEILIADEPTTALDVTIQAQILDLMRNLKREMGAALLLISHDLGVIAEMADEVIVMYAGRIVEQASVHSLFASPRHPYTQGLLASIPKLDGFQDKLEAISGTVPAPFDRPMGCAFHPRCPHADDMCREKKPELERHADDHAVACWHAKRIKSS